MSMHSPDGISTQWMADTGPAPVRLLLAGVEGEANSLVGAKVAGFPLDLIIVDPAEPVDPSVLTGAAAAVVQVNSDDPTSVARFEQLAKGELPLIAAAYEPSLSFVRKLVRAGAHDVVPLPLDPAELETALDPVRRMVAAQRSRARAGQQKIVTMIKSEGGVGATSLLGQLATRFAAGEAKADGKSVCSTSTSSSAMRRFNWDFIPSCRSAIWSRPESGSMRICCVRSPPPTRAAST